MVGENSDFVAIEVVVEVRNSLYSCKCLKLVDAISLFCMTRSSAGIGNWGYFVILLILSKYSLD